MTAPTRRPADLDETAPAGLTPLEDRIGGPLVAYRPGSPYAALTAEQLQEVRRTGSEPGIQLPACRR
ncbi:hypothetical protein WHI96_05930 [Pseudonocardia tropica]|uniref:Uncharacterized protein n=1 Tax=Pseudonocardia tropica TaxID=681289 RepID=A0ABV1JS22_9PSEU